MGLLGLVFTLGAPVFDLVSGSRIETFTAVITGVEQPRMAATAGSVSTQRIFAIPNGGEKEPIFLCLSGCPKGQKTEVAPESLARGATVKIQGWRTLGNRFLALNIQPQPSLR